MLYECPLIGRVCKYFICMKRAKKKTYEECQNVFVTFLGLQ